MSDKPTTVADWTPTGADVVTPAAGEKTAGFQGAERPPAQYVNWFWELITQWIVWINAGYLTRASLTDNTPVMATTDRDGRERHYLGPEGYWMGPAIQQVYEPQDTDVQAGAFGPALFGESRLTGFNDANTSIETTLAAGLTENAPFYQIDILNAATTHGAVIYRAMSHYNFDDACIVLEARIDMDTIGANGCDVWLGIGAGSKNAPTTANHACIVKESTDTNWYGSVAGGGTQTRTDTGVPPVASTFQTIRVEYHGANTPVGVDNTTAPVVRFFIDGTEVLEISGANVPDNADSFVGRLILGASADGTGPTADTTFLCGPIRYAYNEVLSPDVPA